MEQEIRLQKYLASKGIASRRKCEEYIVQGKVKINGEIVKELGIKVNPNEVKIEFNGKEIKNIDEPHVYILLNKPIDYVTTVKDQFGRNSVLDLIKTDKRIVPVGRLDMYTSGALILTDDGDFVYKITHPKHEITKTYTVTLKGILAPEEIKQLEEALDTIKFKCWYYETAAEAGSDRPLQSFKPEDLPEDVRKIRERILARCGC